MPKGVMTESLYDFIKIFASVLLGMFGKTIYDYVKEKIQISRDKNFIIGYLVNAKKIFPVLKNNYDKAKESIERHHSGPVELKQFESFNTEILKSLSFPRYYRVFKTKASIIFEIYHVVNALQKHLPILIFSQYNDAINAIDSKSDIWSQEEIDRRVKLKRDVALAVIDLKLSDIKYLEEKINQLLKQ